MSIYYELLQLRNYAVELDDIDEKIEASYAMMETEIYKNPNVEEIGDVNNKKWNIVYFVILQAFLSGVIQNTMSYLLTLYVNDWVTKEEFFNAGNVGYREEHVYFGFAFLCTIPFTIILYFILKAVIRSLKIILKKRKIKNSIELNRENKEIDSINEKIKEHNEVLNDIISELKSRKNILLEECENLYSFYPNSYISVDVIDYLINRVESGNEKPINTMILDYLALKG